MIDSEISKIVNQLQYILKFTEKFCNFIEIFFDTSFITIKMKLKANTESTYESYDIYESISNNQYRVYFL